MLTWMPETKFACWTRAQHQRSDTSGSSEQHLHNRDERCKQMKEGATETTTVTDMDEVDQQGWHWLPGPAAALLPSLPLVWPSWCQSWVRYKASSVEREKTPCCLFFSPLESRLMLFFVRHSTRKFKMLHKISVVTLLYSTAGLEPAILQKCKWINNKAQRGAVPLKSLTIHVKHRDEVSEKHY